MQQTAGSSRREREKLRQRQEMLTAALNLFSEKGFHNVSMHEIAERAEFAIGTLYKFFKNKEDLYKSLILELSDRFHETLMQALAAGDDEIEKLRSYVQAKGAVFKDNVSTIRLYFAETRGASFNIKAGLDNQIKQRYNHVLDQIAALFKSGMLHKRFKPIADPFHLAVAMDSIANAFLFQWLEAPENNSYPADPDVILNIIFKGLLDS